VAAPTAAVPASPNGSPERDFAWRQPKVTGQYGEFFSDHAACHSRPASSDKFGHDGAGMNQHQDMERRLAALIRSAQGGDGAAYACLLRELTPLLRQRIQRRLRFLRPEDVEDLVQDVLLSLHAVRATYDPQRPFLPWLFSIVRNRVADGARRHARRATHELAVKQWPVTFSTDEANSEESYGDPEALIQEIGRLPPGPREAVQLLKLRELSLKEAAAVSGMSIGSLKVSVHRAVKALRRVLAAKT
jgi:RNA polymerase sigma factor (sigma-70 family)